MNSDERQEIAASVAAHAELGPQYDSAVAEGLVERIGAEIDKRIDARLHRGQPTPPVSPAPQAPPPTPAAAAAAAAPVTPRRSNGVTGMILGLGSMGLGLGVTAVVVSHHVDAVAEVFIVLLIWLAIAGINIAHSQRR